MSRAADFAKRRIAGFLVFWLVVLFFVYVLFRGGQTTPAAGVLILAVAVSASLAYTRRMKRRQREARRQGR